MAIFGIIGYYMEKYGFSPAALVLGVVSGDPAESSFIQSVQEFGSLNPLLFPYRPISAALVLIGIIFLFLPFVQNYLARRRLRDRFRSSLQ